MSKFHLHIAAERGSLKGFFSSNILCEHIMDRIADINPRYLIQEMPFHWAAQEGH